MQHFREPAEPLSTLRQTYLDAMSLFATAVTIVTTDGTLGRDGVTVSALSSVSAETPQPTLLICLHEQSRVAPRLRANGCFCVNLIADTGAHLADRFAGREASPYHGWFDDAQWRPLATGAPALRTALACLDCRVTDIAKVGRHHVIFGAVEAIDLPTAGKPLVRALRGYHRLAAHDHKEQR